jgi:hypothetical protein
MLVWEGNEEWRMDAVDQRRFGGPTFAPVPPVPPGNAELRADLSIELRADGDPELRAGI